MKITVITGTGQKGCTYQIKECFLQVLGPGHEITEFYLPKDLPDFCCGCKNCFFISEERCPHALHVMPIWKSMLESDLIVFASPVYALRTTGQMKSLLDHLCVHWMVHRPEEQMFHKKAVILTNAIGPFQSGAQKDIATSLKWLGISHIRKQGIGLMEGIVWNDLSLKRRNAIISKISRLAKKYKNQTYARQGMNVRLRFALCRMLHQITADKEKILSADNQHWIQKGFIKSHEKKLK
jgi:multimeric flavodoxin WrbA